MDELGTILGIWAHPDDEAWLSAGLMARAVDAGSRIVCVTATRGELGVQDADRWPPERLADIRTAELAETLAILGVEEHRWLDYPDGAVADVDADEAVERLVAVLAEVRPDTVLTMGPDGMTGHIDHITVSDWVTAAVAQHADPSTRLHYATVLPDVWAVTRDEFFRLGISMGGEPSLTDRADLSIDFELDDEMVERKRRALLAQASQVAGLFEVMDPAALRTELRYETYRPA
ncbi:MAG TPA: PIG-L family deacetylase [Mycobacteriales bacterium]|jgi:LmbE family N-acetylglucosaminyl deacetylase|nr:PIG-L family deacetylase [Mycobacteriales bacterium]